MRTFIFCLSFLCVYSAAAAFADEAAPGYTDTPFIPGSQWRIHDQTRPQPPKVKAGTGCLGATPPSDAVVLFDGKDLSQWTGKNLVIEDGTFNIKKTGGIATKQEFGNLQLHLEWKSGTEKEDRMHWGNSGVFLLGGDIEVQIIQSCDSFIYADGNAGAVYGQSPPLVNPARPAGEWESFDIYFTAPKFENEKQTAPPRLTIIYNGVLVQNNIEVIGTTGHKTLPQPITKTKGAVSLQEHGSDVWFRNIWIRAL
ncbi:hypothetical protein FACS1894214_4000 [Planctomycetales bacterium]|nr:hypothetical protein FACS1894214_4000 [Planctomycetales bacterium]